MTNNAKAFLCFLASIGFETIAIVSKQPLWWVLFGLVYIPFLFFLIVQKPNVRRIAWAIRDRRDYITFSETGPRWQWPVERGNIPRYLWHSRKWRDKHIVLPTIRQRYRWPEFKKQAPGVMPKEYHERNTEEGL